MSFWKKLFGNNKEKASTQKGDSFFAKERLELNALNLKTVLDLERLVKPLIRSATIVKVAKASEPPEHATLKSHFGGPPYFQANDKWPTTKEGRPLSFIFQIFNEEGLELPKGIELIQFFYDWEEFPYETESDGWLVKIHKQLEIEKIIQIPLPEELESSKYCEITFEATRTLPDWEGIETYDKNASNLSCILNEDEPEQYYDEIVTKLIGEQDLQSQLGGYPRWIQGEGTPKDKDGKLMKLLFQIDSEDNADIMWGDVGMVYFFYDEILEQIEFELQCH